MLTYWIPDEPCTLPSTATHQVGVGGFVINKNREVILLLLLENLETGFSTVLKKYRGVLCIFWDIIKKKNNYVMLI